MKNKQIVLASVAALLCLFVVGTAAAFFSFKPDPIEVYAIDLQDLETDNEFYRLQIEDLQALIVRNSAKWHSKRCLIEIERFERGIEYEQPIFDNCVATEYLTKETEGKSQAG